MQPLFVPHSPDYIHYRGEGGLSLSLSAYVLGWRIRTSKVTQVSWLFDTPTDGYPLWREHCGVLYRDIIQHPEDKSSLSHWFIFRGSSDTPQDTIIYTFSECEREFYHKLLFHLGVYTIVQFSGRTLMGGSLWLWYLRKEVSFHVLRWKNLGWFLCMVESMSPVRHYIWQLAGWPSPIPT